VGVILALISPATAATPPAQRRTLPNGARLIVSEQHSLPMFVVQIVVDAGARRDPPGREGLASLTADLLTEGTRTRTAAQISEATDFIGASLDTSADTDYAALSLTALTKDLDTALGLFTDVLQHPTFPDAEVARRREAALAVIATEQDDPGRLAQRAFLKALFDGGPYGYPKIGTPEALRTLKRSDIDAFFKRYYRPEGSIITVVGDVSTEDIVTRLQAALKDWNTGAPEPFVYPAASSPPASTPVFIDRPVTQANIILGHSGIARDNPDYYALTVMNFILGGGGFTSRLLDNIRTKGGLAYSVGSNFSVNKSPGSFQIVLQTKNASAEDAIKRACQELDQIRQEPVSDEELSGAQLYLTGSFPLRLDSDAKVAGFLSQVEFFGLGADYADTYAARINAVTKDTVLRVAQQYLHPEQLQLVVVGKLGEARVPSTPPCAPPAAP